jgi:hypothetical protein
VRDGNGRIPVVGAPLCGGGQPHPDPLPPRAGGERGIAAAQTRAALGGGSRGAAGEVGVGGAVAAGVEGGFAARGRGHVYVAVMGGVVGGAGADFEHLRVGRGAVLQAMAVAVVGRKSGGVAGAEDFLAAIGHQHDLAREDIDELVAGGVPVALARPRARRQAQQVDAELGQPGRVAEPGAGARPARLVEGRRIERADGRCQGGDVDALCHGCGPSAAFVVRLRAGFAAWPSPGPRPAWGQRSDPRAPARTGLPSLPPMMLTIARQVDYRLATERIQAAERSC